MARKVFISVLGTGDYKPCTYKGKESETYTNFIQEATLKEIGAEEWDSTDAAYILMTDKARHCNWNIKKGETRLFNRGGKEVEGPSNYDGLMYVLEKMELPFAPNVKDVTIKLGQNEDEIWDIFSSLYQVVETGDQVYFDLTHGLRYLPMLVLVFGNYAKFLKDVTICGISYGSFETPDKDNKAPIINLLQLSKIQDWSFAAADYIKNGYTERLEDLQSKNAQDEHTDTFIDYVAKISLERQTCRGLDIVNNTMVHNAIEQAEKITESDESKTAIFKPIFEKITESFADFKDNDIANCLAAANWCFKNHLYQQTITLLQEGMLTMFCKNFGVDFCVKNTRTKISSAVSFCLFQTDKSKWIPQENTEFYENVIDSKCFINEEVALLFKDLGDTRNNFNHAGFREEQEADIVTEIEGLLDRTKNLLQFVNGKIDEKPKESLFINLSDSPSSTWDTTQREEALKIGNIEDMNLPKIPLEAGEKSLKKNVNRCYNEIIEKAKTYNVTVHIVGELAFTYKLVTKLKAAGVKCVTSINECVSSESNDLKTPVFKFKNFRDF